MLHHSSIELGAPLLPGDLCVAKAARGLVVFAHADGGLRTSRRSAEIAQRLQHRHLGTLLFDLLGPDESGQPGCADDVELLAQRLLQALDHLPASVKDLPLGVLGAGTGAAAALLVAARHPQRVQALVARGGRPDLAAEVLGDLRTPTLLLVAAADEPVLELNRQAFARMRCDKRIEIVPRATHRFLEAGVLEVVSQRAGDWFCTHLFRPAAA